MDADLAYGLCNISRKQLAPPKPKRYTQVRATLEHHQLQHTIHFAYMARTVAGIFSAAKRDTSLASDLPQPPRGLFWDTLSGRRLTKLIGHDATKKQHLQRLSVLRDLLPAICAPHTHTPLLQAHTFDLPRSIRKIDGLNRRCKWNAWSAALYPSEGSRDTPSDEFLAYFELDERAFALESTAAFNLYWVLSARAHSKQPLFYSAGSFEEQLGPLSRDAGISTYIATKVQRERAILRSALEELTRLELLASWDCPILDAQSKGIDRYQFRDARLSWALGTPLDTM